MNNKERFILYDRINQFEYNKSKSDINISFNRVAFIFFIFFIITIIYSIHLIHLGSKKSKENNRDQVKIFNKKKTKKINATRFNLISIFDLLLL